MAVVGRELGTPVETGDPAAQAAAGGAQGAAGVGDSLSGALAGLAERRAGGRGALGARRVVAVVPVVPVVASLVLVAERVVRLIRRGLIGRGLIGRRFLGQQLLDLGDLVQRRGVGLGHTGGAPLAEQRAHVDLHRLLEAVTRVLVGNIGLKRPQRLPGLLFPSGEVAHAITPWPAAAHAAAALSAGSQGSSPTAGRSLSLQDDVRGSQTRVTNRSAAARANTPWWREAPPSSARSTSARL